MAVRFQRLACALAVAAVLCAAGIFQHGLWSPDEPREAEIGREMLVARFSALPTLGDEPFLEKPPLYAWITAASYSVFGVSESSARVPAALFSIGAIGIAYLMGAWAGGRTAGLAAAIVLATMWQFALTSHRGVLDTALTFFVAAGQLAFLRLRTHRGARWYVAIGVCSGLAFLTKAWIGCALMCAPPILAAAALRDREYVTRVLPRAAVAALAGVAILGGPWVLALAHTAGGGWSAVKECLLTEYVSRAVGGSELVRRGHSRAPGYYAYNAIVVLAPWCLVLPAMLRSRSLSRSWRGGRALWLALVFVAGALLLSLPAGKRELYLVPLLPAAAASVGAWLSRVGSRSGGPWDAATCRALTALAWSVLVLVGLGVAYAAFGGRLPAAIAPVARELGYRGFAFGAAVAGGVALVVACVPRVVRRPVLPPVRAAWAIVVLFLFLHAAVRPLLDPLCSMSCGAREIAALVPGSERLVAFEADETTLAVVPFYTGRILENVSAADDEQAAAEAEALLDSGATRHLVVRAEDVRKLTPELCGRLAVVRTVRLSATRDVVVYELER